MGLLLLCLVALFACGSGQSPRVTRLVRNLTLAQKIGLLHGTAPTVPIGGDNYVGQIGGIPALGIPPLNMEDGPQGTVCVVVFCAHQECALTRRSG
jgi:hypothetical protein